VDNFSTCDNQGGQICDLAGRSGTWYSFASANVNQTFVVSSPPSGWVDRSCAAWSTGGPVTGVTASSTYAGIGMTLNSGGPINLGAFVSVTVHIETGQMLTFVVKDGAGGYFGSSAIGGGTGTQSYTITFSSLTKLSNSQTNQLDLSQATAFEFDAVTPLNYGFAVHLVIIN
jgi:hypothetical protein